MRGENEGGGFGGKMSELVLKQKFEPIQLFTDDNIDPLLEAITNEVKAFEPDMTTNKGRKEIASIAHKVAQSKTYLDGLGKDLVAEWKQKAKVVDASRKKMRDYLDNLKEEVRAPLTEWENKEKERIQKYTDKLRALEGWLNPNFELDSQGLKTDLEALQAIEITDEWEEFKDKGIKLKSQGVEAHEKAIAKKVQEEAERAELERLRKEKEDQERKEREERIAREAAERAKREAEERARLEKEEAERKARLEAERVERERQELIKKQKEAEERAKRLEQEKIEAAKREEERKKQVEIERKQAEERAREEERLRIQREKEREAAEAAKREANKRHKAKINNAAARAITESSPAITEELARGIVTAIAKGEIPNVRIEY